MNPKVGLKRLLFFLIGLSMSAGPLAWAIDQNRPIPDAADEELFGKITGFQKTSVAWDNPSCGGKDKALNDQIDKLVVNGGGAASSAFHNSEAGEFNVSIKCVGTIMKSGFWKGPLAHYWKCDGKTGQEQPLKPCITENYAKVVKTSLEASLHCLKDLPNFVTKLKNPPRSKEFIQGRAEMIVGMFGVESGMHIMARNPNGDAGPGQLTKNAIDRINGNSPYNYKTLHQYLAQHKDGMCRSMAGEFAKPMGLDPCSRLGIENGNPVKNIMYSIANVMDNEWQVQSAIEKDMRDTLTPGLSELDEGRMMVATSVWAHNTGAGGFIKALKQISKSYDKLDLAVMTFDQKISLLSRTLKSQAQADKGSNVDLLCEGPPSECKGHSYFPKVNEEYKNGSRGAGGTCVDYFPKQTKQYQPPVAPAPAPSKPQSIEDLLEGYK